jgi:hypothetical protein
MDTNFLPVTVFDISDAERDAQLVVGVDALAALVKVEREKVERLETLLNVVRAAQSTSYRILMHAEIAQAFAASYPVLNECYCEGGTVEFNDKVASFAMKAERAIGIASGEYVTIVGGNFSTEDEEPYSLPWDVVDDMIRKFGLKERLA